MTEIGRRLALRGRKSLRHRLRGRAPGGGLCVFVTGQQRSGTNMVMDVLERSPDTDVYHETDPRAFVAYEMRPADTIASLHGRSRAPFFVIKALCEAQDIRHLLDAFAPARALWIVRDYADVANSMGKNFSSTATVMKRIRDDRQAGGWRSRGMSDDTYARVQALVRSDISEEAAAALQWYVRNVLYFELGLADDERVMLVYYEDLVTRPAAAFERICGFLGLRYSATLTSTVFASSVGKHAPPDMDPQIVALCEDLWSRYKRLPIAATAAPSPH